MMHALMIELRRAEGAALRALGLAERRGFRVLSMSLSPQDADTQRLDLLVTSPERSVEVLGRQLERLYDVLEVVIQRPARRHNTETAPVAVGVA